MEEENKEDTTSETNEEVSKETVAEEKKPDFKAKADAMYGKFKASEEKVKELETKLEAKTKDKAPELGEIERIAQVTTALSGLDKDEQARLITEAKMKGVSLLEAKKDEDFLLWKKAHSDKVELDKQNLTPSTKQDSAEGEKPVSEMSIEEKDKHFQKIGLIRKPKRWQKK